MAVYGTRSRAKRRIYLKYGVKLGRETEQPRAAKSLGISCSLGDSMQPRGKLRALPEYQNYAMICLKFVGITAGHDLKYAMSFSHRLPSPRGSLVKARGQ